MCMCEFVIHNNNIKIMAIKKDGVYHIKTLYFFLIAKDSWRYFSAVLQSWCLKYTIPNSCNVSYKKKIKFNTFKINCGADI